LSHPVTHNLDDLLKPNEPNLTTTSVHFRKCGYSL